MDPSTTTTTPSRYRFNIYFCAYVGHPGNAGKCRPRKRWRDVLENDLKKGRLDRGLAKDKDKWKAQIMAKTSDL